MLKWFRRLIVFLLLGAIVNVAVAWGCVWAATRDAGTSGWYVNPRLEQARGFESFRQFGYEQVRPISGLELDISPMKHPVARKFNDRVWWPADSLITDLTANRHFASGWPLLSLRTWLNPDPDFADPWLIHPNAGVHWGVDLDKDAAAATLSKKAPFILPLHTIWIGFGVNTMLYAAILAALYFAPRLSRSAIRERRGQCPACGYPRGTSPVCTECGEALPDVAPK